MSIQQHPWRTLTPRSPSQGCPKQHGIWILQPLDLLTDYHYWFRWLWVKCARMLRGREGSLTQFTPPSVLERKLRPLKNASLIVTAALNWWGKLMTARSAMSTLTQCIPPFSPTYLKISTRIRWRTKNWEERIRSRSSIPSVNVSSILPHPM